jgi:hypothetical protein
VLEQLDPVLLVPLPAAVVAQLDFYAGREGWSAAPVTPRQFVDGTPGSRHPPLLHPEKLALQSQALVGLPQPLFAIGESASHAPTLPRLCRIEKAGRGVRDAPLLAFAGMLAWVIEPALQLPVAALHQQLGPVLGRGGFAIRQLGQERLLVAQHRPAPPVAQVGLIALSMASSAPVR